MSCQLTTRETIGNQGVDFGVSFITRAFDIGSQISEDFNVSAKLSPFAIDLLAECYMLRPTLITIITALLIIKVSTT